MLALGLGGVGVLHHPGHPAVLAPHHPAHAGGVVGTGGEEGGGGVALPVLGHQVAEGGRADEGRVAGQDDDVGVVEVGIVGEGGEGHGQGVGRAPGDPLLDEVDEEVGRAVLLEGLGDGLGPVADHHDRPLDVELGQGVEHVEEHRPPAQRVERLGQRRPHPGAVARRHDHRTQRTHLHAPSSTPNETRSGASRSAREGGLEPPLSGSKGPDVLPLDDPRLTAPHGIAAGHVGRQPRPQPSNQPAICRLSSALRRDVDDRQPW